MADIPADAPRSDDGQWWWDGNGWKPVESQATPAPEIAKEPVMADIPADAPRSDDGQWWWNGTGWKPVEGQATPAPEKIAKVSVSALTARPSTSSDGTTITVVEFTLTNDGATSIEPERLNVVLFAASASDATEAGATLDLNVQHPIAPGEAYQFQGPLQVDPGSWTLSVNISDTTSGALLADPPELAVHVAGQQATRRSFDDTRPYALAIRITQVEHVEGSLFRVHYGLQNNSDRELPAGLAVVGDVDGAGQVPGSGVNSVEFSQHR